MPCDYGHKDDGRLPWTTIVCLFTEEVSLDDTNMEVPKDGHADPTDRAQWDSKSAKSEDPRGHPAPLPEGALPGGLPREKKVGGLPPVGINRIKGIKCSNVAQ